MLVKTIFLICVCVTLCGAVCSYSGQVAKDQTNSVRLTEGIFYDSFRGTPSTEDELIEHIKENRTFWCVNEIKPCDPNEWRRLDGSCNNLKHPTIGAAHTPTTRILPPVYSGDFEPRKSVSGKPLPPTRVLRTELLSEAHVPDQTFTVLASYFILFVASEITSNHDTINYMTWTPHCCKPEGKTDPMCAPMEVPEDDPVHRHSGIRCMNMTKPLTFQDFGCTKRGSVPERIVTSTPMFDMSTVYGNTLTKSLEGRLYEGGLLKYEVEEGRIWPPQDLNSTTCASNRKPRETRCHGYSADAMNSLLPINLISIWFWRLHNHIANGLAKINPCWNDERIFYTARDINIAIETQILYYELMPLFLGYENLVRDKVLSSTLGHRDLYDETLLPQITMEFPIALRWFHKMQESRLKMYNADGELVNTTSLVEMTFRTGNLPLDGNLDHLTQGSFRQPSARIDDNVVDPDMAERIMGPNQQSQDVFASDMARDRLMFIPPYIKYVEHFYGEKISSFEDLEKYFEPEVLEKLSELYNESVENLDLLAGMEVGKSLEGGFVPPVLYSIVVDQLMRTMKSDRHWYESSKRPYAFKDEQLREMRKATVAYILCTVGDTVTKIQPHAFQRMGPNNEMQDCKNIPKIDLTAWKDDSCKSAVNNDIELH